MEINPIVSIVLPAYNAAVFLKECIDSILHQDFKNWELVIVDDGSIDDTRRIAESFVAFDSRITLIPQINRGVSVARNVGLDHTRGEYVMFIDSDDLLPEHALSTLYRVACAFPAADMVRGEYEGINERGEKLFSSNKHVFNKKKCYEENNIDSFYRKYIRMECFLWLMWIKRSCIGSHRFVDGHIYMEDAEFLYHILENARSGVYVPAVVYQYRKYDAAASASLSVAKLCNVMDLALHLNKLRTVTKKRNRVRLYSEAIGNCWGIVFDYLWNSGEERARRITEELGMAEKLKSCMQGADCGTAEMRDFMHRDLSCFLSRYAKRKRLMNSLRLPQRVVLKLKEKFG